MSTFSIEIDATALFYRQFIVIGAGSAFIDSRQVQRLDLTPGSYPIQVQSGVFTAFGFRITDAGVVDFDAAFDAIASGRGGTRLTLTGFEIGIDARGITNMNGGVVLFASIPLTGDDWIGNRRIRLLPQTNYMVQQGSGVVCELDFAVGTDGLVHYRAEQDRARGGCMSGDGSDTLTLHGFALTVDASAVSRILALPNLWGLQPSFDGRLDIVVLPAASFSVQLDPGVSDALFQVGPTGTVAPANSPADFRMIVDAGAVPVLRVLPPAPPQPGPLTDAVYDFGRFRIVVGSDATAVQRVAMQAGTTLAWSVDRRWLAGDATFGTHASGNVHPVGQPGPQPRQGRLSVTLSASRWPGSDLSADFTLTVDRAITPDGVEITVSMSWTLGNGSFESDDTWDGHALADVVASGHVAALGPQGSIDFVGGDAVQADFRPGALSLSGAAVARVTQAGATLTCSRFEIDAVAPGATVLLDAVTAAPLHVALHLTAGAPWPIALPVVHTPLGDIAHAADRFETALVELGENPDGRRRQAEQFSSSAPDPSFSMNVTGLLDARSQPLAANIGACTLFLNHDSDPPRGRLRGLATTAPTWVRAQGVGIHFGPMPFTTQTNFDLRFNDATVTSIDVQLGFGGVVTPFDGFVTEPLGEPALIALLPTGSQPDPARQRNALVVEDPAVPLLLRDFAFGLLRPQDLLRLRFDFSGRRLRASSGRAPWLEVEVAGQAGAMVVGLEPQHRAEESFGVSTPLPPLPIRMRLAGGTRIALALASADAIELSPEFLLDWPRHALSVAPVCTDVPPPLPPSEPPGVHASGPPVTAIELPYRLLLSPGIDAGFAHAMLPAQQGEWTELWHTRLAARRPSASVPSGFVVDERGGATNDAARRIRAIWSPDYTPDRRGVPDLPFDTALPAPARAQIVDASANTLAGDPGMALDTAMLALSSQGGWLHTQGARDPSGGNDLAAWSHAAALGRDQHVRRVERGVLYPFGFEVDKVTLTDRIFAGAADNAAALRTSTFLQIVAQARDYRDLPADTIFASLELALQRTPTVDFVPIYTPPGSQVPTVAWVGDFFAFPLHGRDRLGNACSFSAAAIFVARSALADTAAMGAASTAYEAQRGAATRSTLDGQRLAFAPEDRPGDTSFATRVLDFGAGSIAAGSDGIAFYPRIAGARIEPTALRALANADPALADGIDVVFADAYLGHGFDVAFNPGQALLALATPVSIGFEGDKALGVASPAMTVGALSRHLGTLPANVGAMFPPGQPDIDLTTFFPVDAKLLGSIPLASLIPCVVAPPIATDVPVPPGGPSEVPVVKAEMLGDGADRRLVTRLSWQPRIRGAAPAIAQGSWLQLLLNAREPSAFTLESTRTTSLAPGASAPASSSLTQGRLTNFDLAFGPSGSALATVRFAEFSFVAQDGRKPETRLAFESPPIALGGDLDFLATLIDALRDILGGGPRVGITATQIAAGYAVAVPQLSIGIFSLANISIGAGVTIPLVGAAPVSFRFNFAEEHHPFNLTVSLLGGGGYFSLSLNSDAGIDAIDFAVEAGASVSLDLAGLASGSAHVMLGASFHFAPGQFALGGYLRAGGELTVLSVLSLHVEFYAGFVYKRDGARQYLHASVSVMVEVTVACLSQSVTLTLERDFDVGSGSAVAVAHGRPALAAPSSPGVGDMMSAADWAAYAAAFA